MMKISKRLRHNLWSILIYWVFTYALLLPLKMYWEMVTISILIAFLFNLFNDIITQLRKLNGESFPDIEDKRDIVAVVKEGMLYIDNIICTFDTKEIRDELEDMFEDCNHFVLPDKFTYRIITSMSGRNKVARIRLK